MMLLSSAASAPPSATASDEDHLLDGARVGAVRAVYFTHLHDLPEAILAVVFAMVGDTRSRNAMALVCRRWRFLERSTRASLSLRGNVRDLVFAPACFRSVTRLDLSLLSPWGSSFLHPPPGSPHRHYHGGGLAVAEEAGVEGGDDDGFSDWDQLVLRRLRLAFPAVIDLTVYARSAFMVRALALRWPGLRRVKLVRWHPRPVSPPLGFDIAPLLRGCPTLASLDLSDFHCWTQDLPPALQAGPWAAASLTRLDLLGLFSGEGFQSRELLAISRACPNLRHLRASCAFHPLSIDFVGDDALLGLAANCPRLFLLHLVDASAISASRTGQVFTPEYARISAMGLEGLFAGLPLLEDLTLDVCHSVVDAGPALEALSSRCPRIESLKLGQFQGICPAAGLHLDGVSVCGRLKSLSIKNSADLTDAGLVSIARGCSRLSRFEIQGCHMVTEVGVRRLASIRRRTLVDVSVSGCKRLNAVRSLWAVEPIRDRVERLHIDCFWSAPGSEELLPGFLEEEEDDFDEFQQENCSSNGQYPIDDAKKNRCRTAAILGDGSPRSFDLDDCDGIWCRSWKSLRRLSLWVPVGESLTPLAEAGLESCPRLEEIRIKVEGDCRSCATPDHRTFGLDSLARYPRLWKMNLDCGGATGYKLTAPTGESDLSLWERFHLRGIEHLSLYELDYWPPQGQGHEPEEPVAARRRPPRRVRYPEEALHPRDDPRALHEVPPADAQPEGRAAEGGLLPGAGERHQHGDESGFLRSLRGCAQQAPHPRLTTSLIYELLFFFLLLLLLAS